MRSAQGVYPVCAGEDTAVAFVEFIHDKAITILQEAGGIWAPHAYVSLMQRARNHVVRSGFTAGVCHPESQAAALEKVKHFFPLFTIRFRTEHSLVNAAKTLETLAPRDYQGQILWRDGRERLTIDLSSFPLASDGSRHPRFSADFAYYSLPVILATVIQAWNASRAATSPFNVGVSPTERPRQDMATTEHICIPRRDPFLISNKHRWHP